MKVKRLITLLVALASLLFYSFEAHDPAPLAVNGEPACFYSTPSKVNLRDTIIESLRRAEESILIVVYTLKDAGIIKALNEKASNGLSITVVCDAEASAGVEKKLSPKIKLTMRKAQGLMHNKWIVIDREQVWVGSANFTGDSFKKHFNMMENVKCKELAVKIIQKANQFTSQSFEQKQTSFSYSIKKRKVELLFLPDEIKAVEKLGQLIDSAKKSIRVAMFTFTRRDLAEKLVEAKKRGVDVAVAIDHGTAHNASQKIAAYLKKEKVPLFYNSGKELLHHKFVYIDGKILAHGSANWTLAAFKQNDDCIMIHFDLTKEQKSILESAWRNLVTKAA